MISDQVVIGRFGRIYQFSGNERKVRCPNCNKKAMWVNVNSSQFFCFACYHKGVLNKSLVVSVPLDFEQKKVYSIPDLDWVFNREQAPDHWDYIKKRGINPSSITFGKSGDYATFPVWSDHKVVYWQGRNIYHMKPKTKNPPKDIYGVGRSDVLFNLEDVNGIIPRNHVIIVEGIFDALTINGVAMFGSYLSEKQALLLQKVNPSMVTVLHDDDVPGHIVYRNQQVLRKKLIYSRIRSVNLTKGDPNSLGYVQTMNFVDSLWGVERLYT